MEPTPKQLRKRPKWKEDVSAPQCDEVGCSVKFGVLKRRHHCRGCGYVYCAEHCKATLAIPFMGYYSEVKVCHSCVTHGVEDPDNIPPEAPRKEKKEKKKKDKKSKKEKKEKRKSKKAAAEEVSEEANSEATVSPSGGPPPVPPPPGPGAPSGGPPPVPGYGAPPPIPGQGPPVVAGGPPPIPPPITPPPVGSSNPNPDVFHLQRRIDDLENKLQQQQQQLAGKRVRFNDPDGDQIEIFKSPSHGELQYSVNGENRPPFSRMQFHAEGPALELTDIDKVIVLPTDCYKHIRDLIEIAAEVNVDIPMAMMSSFCTSCKGLKCNTPFCCVTGKSHGDDSSPERTQRAVAVPASLSGTVLPQLAELEKASVNIGPPLDNKPVFADGWSSSDDDDSDWESPSKGRGAIVAAQPPVATNVPLPIEDVPSRPILPYQIPPSDVGMQALPAAPTVPVESNCVASVPLTPPPDPIVGSFNSAVLSIDASTTPTSAPAKPPPGIKGAKMDPMAAAAAGARNRLRKTSVVKKSEPAVVEEPVAAGQHLLRSSQAQIPTSKKSPSVSPVNESLTAPPGQHLLKCSFSESSSAVKSLPEDPVGQHLLRSIDSSPVKSPSQEPLPPGRHMLKSSFAENEESKPEQQQQQHQQQQQQQQAHEDPEPAPAANTKTEEKAPPTASKGPTGMMKKKLLARRAASESDESEDDW